MSETKHCWHLANLESNGNDQATRRDLCCWCGEHRMRILVTKPAKKGAHGEALHFPIVRRVVKSSIEPFECIRQGSLFSKKASP